MVYLRGYANNARLVVVSKRCSWKGKPCSTGYECTNCTNTDTYDNLATSTSEDTNLLDVTVEEYLS